MNPQIAIFDYKVTSTNPVGGCHLRMIVDLCDQYDFTVFAVEFENPRPGRVRWVRIPAPTRPLALLFVVFHLLAPIYYWFYRIVRGCRFDAVQMVESNLSFGNISYAQFCHRAYLRDHWGHSRSSGLRGWLRWIDHKLHSLTEPWVFRNVRNIIVPSRGLARELQSHYPRSRTKVQVLPNPLDISGLRRPANFDRNDFRARHNLRPDNICLLFIALGHFERKGLPLLLEALTEVGDPCVQLIVVGGSPDLVTTYRERVNRGGLQSQVTFVGMQRDLSPYLWGSDAFVFPSFYETFSLVSYEAAAAGLPVIATPLYGVEEFLRDGVNGFLIERTAAGVANGIRRLIALPLADRHAMGLRAQSIVCEYTIERFTQNWRIFYSDLLVG